MTSKNIAELQRDLNLLIDGYGKLISNGDYNASMNALKHIDILNKILANNDCCQERSIPVDQVSSCKIKHNGEAVVKNNGGEKMFVAEFYDEGGNVINSIIPRWDMSLPSELQGIIKFRMINSSILVSIDTKLDLPISFILGVCADDKIYGQFGTKINVNINDLW